MQTCCKSVSFPEDAGLDVWLLVIGYIRRIVVLRLADRRLTNQSKPRRRMMNIQTRVK